MRWVVCGCKRVHARGPSSIGRADTFWTSWLRDGDRPRVGRCEASEELRLVDEVLHGAECRVDLRASWNPRLRDAVRMRVGNGDGIGVSCWWHRSSFLPRSRVWKRDS